MNITTFRAKFNIGNNKDLAKAIMRRLAENNPLINENTLDTYIEDNSCEHIYVEGARTSFSSRLPQFFKDHTYPEMTLNDLYPPTLSTRTVIVNDEPISLSEESYQTLKEALIG